MKIIQEIYRKYITIYSLTAFSIFSIYVYFVITFAINIPFGDDFDAIFGWMINYYNQTNSYDQFISFFALHNEHRITLNYIFQIILYKIFGHINLEYMVYFGNFALVCIAGFFIKIISELDISSKSKHITQCISVVLLFNLSFHESALRAMASISNMRVIVFALWALYFANKYHNDTKIQYIIYAILLSICGIMTQGNGIFILPSIIVSSIILQRFKYIWIYCIFCIFTTVLYFIGYSTPNAHGSFFQNSIYFIQTPFVRSYPFAFFGSALSLVSMKSYVQQQAMNIGFTLSDFITYGLLVMSSIISGAYIVYVYGKFVYHKYARENNPIILYLIIFLTINMLVTTIGRVHFGTRASRYMLYSLISFQTIILIYCTSLKFLSKNHISQYRNQIYIFVICCIYSLGVNIGYGLGGKLLSNNNLYISDIQNYAIGGNLQYIYPRSIHGIQILNEAIKKGYYQIPQKYINQ